MPPAAACISVALILVTPGASAAFGVPPVGIIDVYGLRSVSEAQVREALGVRIGDSVTASKSELAARLRNIPGVEEAEVRAVCCERGKLILYVGVAERGAPSLRFAPVPADTTLRLPTDVLRAEASVRAAFDEAAQHGDLAEDQSQGHSLMHYPAARRAQEAYIPLAARHGRVLRRVLSRSGLADQRAIAAEVLAYAADKRTVVGDLVAAARDPAPDVRNSAVRALGVIATFGKRHPERKIHVPAEPFVELLNSIVWTDRNKASMALYALTARDDAATLALVHRRAMASLLEIAKWTSRGHAHPAIFLLGRMAGMSEEQIFEAWKRDDRAGIIAAARSRYQ